MTRLDIHGVTIECVLRDIAKQPGMDAIVNTANAELRIGGGMAGAIHRAAGWGLEEECQPLAPIQPGQAVITGAHNLPNRYVFHCLGPGYGLDEPSDQLLASCYCNTYQVHCLSCHLGWGIWLSTGTGCAGRLKDDLEYAS